MAISVRGRIFLTSLRNSRPDICAILRSQRMISGASSSSSARAASPLSASKHWNPSDLPMVMQSLRMLCWSSTTRNRTRKSSVMMISKYSLDDSDEVLHTKWLLDARGTCAAKGARRIFIHDVAGNKDQPVVQLGAVNLEPVVHVGPVHTTGSTHIGDDAEVIGGLKLRKRSRAAVGADDGVATGGERRLNECHH